MTVISGPLVASNSAATRSPLDRLLDVGLTGIRGFIDVEVARQAAKVPDRADVREVTQADAPKSTLGARLGAITPIQIGGIAVASGLFIALVTGQFR